MAAAKQSKGALEVAIENLTNELKGHRDETREDFKELRIDVKDIKSDMSDVKARLCVIESQNKAADVGALTSRVQAIEIRNDDKDSEAKWNLDRFAAYGGVIGTVVLAIIQFFHR